MKPRPALLTLALLTFITAISLTASGALYTNTAVDYGWYLNDGTHVLGNHNYRVGFNSLDNFVYRNFFVFDLSGRKT